MNKCPEAVQNMAITILWITASCENVQQQIVRVGLVSPLLSIIRNTATSIEERINACNVFELVAMQQKGRFWDTLL